MRWTFAAIGLGLAAWAPAARAQGVGFLTEQEAQANPRWGEALAELAGQKRAALRF